MNRKQSFQRNLLEREKWGKPLPNQGRAEDVDVSSIPKGIDQVFNFLFSRDNNIWLSATTFLDGMANENFILRELLFSFMEPSDRYIYQTSTVTTVAIYFSVFLRRHNKNWAKNFMTEKQSLEP